MCSLLVLSGPPDLVSRLPRSEGVSRLARRQTPRITEMLRVTEVQGHYPGPAPGI